MKKKYFLIIILTVILVAIISIIIISKVKDNLRGTNDTEIADTNEEKEHNITDDIGLQEENEGNVIEDEVDSNLVDTTDTTEPKSESTKTTSNSNTSNSSNSTTSSNSNNQSTSDSNKSNSVTVDTHYKGDIHLSDDGSASGYVMESNWFDLDIDTSEWTY